MPPFLRKPPPTFLSMEAFGPSQEGFFIFFLKKDRINGLNSKNYIFG